MNLEEIERRISEVEEKVRHLGVSLARSFENVRRDPAITCTNNRTILEYMLRDLWKRLHFKGSADRKQLEDLLAALPQKMEQLGEETPAIPRRIHDLMRGIQLTGNRATHHPNEVVEDDAVDSLRELSEVVLWYFVNFLPSFGKIADTAEPSLTEPVAVSPPAAPLVSVSSPGGAEKWEAGESHEIVWNLVPGGPESKLTAIEIELWKDGAKVDTLAGRDSGLRGDAQSYLWAIPTDAIPGDNYRLKVIAWDSLGQSGHSFSSGFSIVTKAPPTAEAPSLEMRRREPTIEQPIPSAFLKEPDSNRAEVPTKTPSGQRISKPLIVAAAFLVAALLAGIWFFSVSRKPPMTQKAKSTPTPTPAALAGGRPLYEDDFQTFNPGWGTPGEVLSVKDGKFIITPVPDRSQAVLNQSNVFDYADITVDVTLSQGDELTQAGGLIFWGRNYNDYYCLLMKLNGSFAIYRWLNDRWLYPIAWQNNPEIKTAIGQVNKLRVVTKGRQATAYINDKEVATFSGQPPPGGGCIGLYGESSKTPNIWQFSNLKVIAVDGASAPTPTPTGLAGNQVLYEDDFATFNPGWGAPGQALSVKDGKFIITPVPDRRLDALNQSSVFDNADITVEATMSQGDDLTQAGGLIFWGKDRNDYYCLMIKLNGRFTISRWFNDRWLNPIAWQDNPEVKTAVGQVNKLRVVTKGRQATAYINDKEVATFSGQPPPGGGCIGLYGESGKSQNIWQFSNLKVIAVSGASVPTPTPTGLAGDQVLYEDDFAAFNPGWGVPGEVLSVKDGKFIITPAAGYGKAVLNQWNIFKDADVTVESTMSQGDDLTQSGGLIFWGKDHNDYYCLDVALNGKFMISRRVNDRWLYPIASQDSPEIDKTVGQINRLRVVTKGRRATAYINDKQVATFPGQPPPGGGCIGLYGQSGKSQNIWQFSNLKVTALSAALANSLVLSEDNFAAFSPGWGTPGELLNVKDGKFIITAMPNRGSDALNQSNVFDDADITVEATMSQGDDLTQAGGLIFWGKDRNDYYCLNIALNGRFMISRWFNDRWLYPIAWQNNPEIKTAIGQVNKLRVMTKGRQATAYINDKEVATFSGQPPPGGGFIGLYGQSGKSPNIWQFSNLKVTTPQ